MNISKNVVKQSVIILAREIGKEASYSSLFDVIGHTLPEIVKMISYELFLAKFNYNECNDNTLSAYDIVHSYANKLALNGYVNFSK